jgi:hypothetical protein
MNSVVEGEINMKNRNNLMSAKKVAHAIRIICNIFFWAALAYTVVPILLSLLAIVTGLPVADSVVKFTLSFVLPVIYVSVTFIVSAVFLSKLLKSVEDGEPFITANVKRLRIISIAMIAGSFLKPIIMGIYIMAFNTHALDFRDMITLSQIYRNFVVDISLLIAGLLILVLSFVFSYGAHLQREHDQTV